MEVIDLEKKMEEMKDSLEAARVYASSESDGKCPAFVMLDAFSICTVRPT